MRFRDIKIEKQFWLIIVFIFFVVLILGAISLNQSHRLWKQTQNLYEHPLKVSRAISSIKTDIILLDKDLEDFLQETDMQKQNVLLQNLEDTQRDVERQLGILNKNYLGPKTDIQKV